MALCDMYVHVCCRQRPLEDLLQLLAAESAPELPPWFIAIDTLAQHLNTTPSRWGRINALCECTTAGPDRVGSDAGPSRWCAWLLQC
jgi:hypothetical protein